MRRRAPRLPCGSDSQAALTSPAFSSRYKAGYNEPSLSRSRPQPASSRRCRISKPCALALLQSAQNHGFQMPAQFVAIDRVHPVILDRLRIRINGKKSKEMICFSRSHCMYNGPFGEKIYAHVHSRGLRSFGVWAGVVATLLVLVVSNAYRPNAASTVPSKADVLRAPTAAIGLTTICSTTISTCASIRKRNYQRQKHYSLQDAQGR